LLPEESERIEEDDIDSQNEMGSTIKPKMKELRISYLNGVKGALDDIENNPSSSEDEVIANRSSHKSLEREDL
jgi:hypothetical protein